jgi:glycosyltransferase involved in cell wall biosynthesis
VPTPNQRRPDRIAAPQWTIGMVALLRERKGLETLLHALPELRRTSDVRLRIVGPFETDAYERRMLALANSLGIAQHIDWVGFTNDVNEQLMQMDALVLPSVLPEGMPMVLLEALAAGVPIVGSRVDGIIDVIRHDQNGLLAEPANASSLACQLHRLITGEVCWQQLRNQGLRDYRHCFSNRAMGSGVAAVYDLILSEQDLKSARRLNQELAT